MSDYMIEFPEDEVIEVLFDDIIVTGAEPPSGTISITENGNYDVTDYAGANVNVPQGVFPSGTLAINENGSYDVTNYAGASVNVPTFPDNMNYLEMSGNNTNILTIPYDTNKTVRSVFFHAKNVDTGLITSYLAYNDLRTGNWTGAEIDRSNVNEFISVSGFTAPVISDGNVTVTGRGTTYLFKNNVTYQIFIFYD